MRRQGSREREEQGQGRAEMEQRGEEREMKESGER